MALKKEIERRFLLRGIDRAAADLGVGQEIVQGYLDAENRGRSLRVRITDRSRAHIALKIGRGLEREEHEVPTDLLSAQVLLLAANDIITKRRHVIIHDGQEWTVDICGDSLRGIIIAEAELLSRDTPLALPNWMIGAEEVTHAISNRELARLATELRGLDHADFSPGQHLPRRIPKIVITGGPCAGKTSILKILKEEFSAALHCVPETVSMLIREVGAAPPIHDPVGMRRYNRHLSHLQRHIERAAELQAVADGKRALLLDRGVVDNAAYVPDGIADIERLFNTTRDHEYSEYDLVIVLETPAREVYEARSHNNPARYEDYDRAALVSARVRGVWNDHPNVRVITAGISWDGKVAAVRRAVRSFLDALPT